ncbi:hypothetical protein AUR64_18705 [Haloprofundus marisrubri]|uniref:Bacterio-opsin activator n=1 Tax=Haloprofundus marisrubri TaxID=1514971 RepID=A0A0W1R644_9EURY|nr:helix-turn-helix domain-containing protein [Haloprofundus marisrubri]KTG08695.1 hypothetical protein AUR64_18705 [Haloprofundus marisrubri]
MVRFDESQVDEETAVRPFSLADTDGAALGDVLATETRELVFRSEALAQPFLAAVDSPEDVSFSIDAPEQLPDGTLLQYSTVVGMDPRTYQRILEQFPTVIETSLLRRSDGSIYVETHTESDSISAIFDEFGGRTKRITLRDGALVTVGELPATVETEAVAEEVQSLYPDMELAADRLVPSSRLSHAVVTDKLTDRQLTALTLAHRHGYFEAPRRATGAEVAEEMGITKQTFHNHLRRAQAVVFDQLFGSAESSRSTDG